MRFKGGWTGEPKYEEVYDYYDYDEEISEPYEDPLDLKFEEQDRKSIINQLINYFGEEVEVEIK